jgi:TonB family protein
MTRFWLGLILVFTPICVFAQAPSPYPYAYPTIKVCGKKPHQPCITAPKMIGGNPPKYSDGARKNKFQGTVELSFVVDTDGHTRDIHILSPLGMGLDEEAIFAVESWTFHPGISSDGKSVPVPMHVNVTFHLL